MGTMANGLLNESEEHLAAMPRPTPIEPERELVEVVIQMRVADPTVMRAEQPSFEQRDHPVDSREQLGGQGVLAAQIRHAVAIPVGFQPGIAIPAVGVHGAAGFDGLGDKGLQRLGPAIGNAPHPDAANASAPLLGRHNDQGFLAADRPRPRRAHPARSRRPRRARSASDEQDRDALRVM